MKVEIDRKALLDATREVAKFLPRFSSFAPVNHVLVDAHSGIVALTATDLEMGRRVEVETEVKEEGTVLVPSGVVRVVAGAVGDTVSLSATKANLTITSAKSSWRLPLGTREDYPKTEPSGDGAKVPIESWDHIRAVATMAGGGSARTSLQAVCLQEGKAVATDSYRIAHVEASETTDHPEALIPARAILSLDTDVTALELSDRAAYARTDDGAWWSRLIDEKYVNWKPLVEGIKPLVEIKVDTEDLVAAIKRADIIAEGTIPVLLTPSDGVLGLSVKHPPRSFEDEVAAEVSGEGEAVAFNTYYLRSVVELVSVVTLGFQPSGAARITGDNYFHAALMPVKM